MDTTGTIRLSLDAAHEQPLVRQIERGLREQVASGKLGHGERLPSMRRLSDDLGVSVGIIRQAITQLSNDGVLRSDARRGVFVSRPAVAVRDVALVVPMLRGANLMPVLEGLRLGFLGTPYRTVIEAAEENFDDQAQMMERLDRAFVAGAIVMPPPLSRHAPALRRLKERGIPAVQISLHLDELNTPAVVCDEFERGRLGMTHLIERGHRRIGLVDNTADARGYRDLRAGIDAALRRVGMTLADLPRALSDAAALDAEHPVALGEQTARRLLESAPDLTAVVGMTPNLTLGAVRALRNAGRKVHAEVSVLSIQGDTAALEHLHPPVTALETPFEAIAERAAAILHQMIEGGSVAQHAVQLPASLIERGSVRDLSRLTD